MKKKYNTIVRNIATKDLLFLLAKANSMEDCPYVDVIFDIERKVILISPVSEKEHTRRVTPQDKVDLNIEGIINNI